MHRQKTFHLFSPLNPKTADPKLLSLAPLFIGMALTIAVYWPGLHGSFFFDDEPNILTVEEIRIEHLSFESIKLAFESGFSGPLGRPISQLSFALNYYFSGFDPFAFKLTNLVIHCLNGLLVYLIAVLLLAATRQKQRNEKTQLLAAIVAAAWLLNPIQLTSVLYVVQRMASLSALFLLAAVWLHIKGRQQQQPNKTVYLLISWLVLWPLSVLSKETGFLFAGYILAYEVIVRRSQQHSIDLFARILLGTCIALGAGFIIYLLTTSGNQWLLGGYATRTFTLTERLLTEPRIIWNYLGLIAFPRLEAFSLHHDDIVVSTSLLRPWTTLPAILGIAVLLLSAWRARTSQPLIAFGIAWFLLGHSIESTFISLELAHEHRNYVPAFGILLLPVTVFRLVEKEQIKRMAWAGAMLVLLVYTGFVTALRSHQFGDEVRRTQLDSQHHPLSSRSNYEAARALVFNIVNNGSANMIQVVMARKHYELSLQLDPASKTGYLGLMHLHCLTGQKVDPVWIDELAARLENKQFALTDRSLMYSLKELMIARTLCLDNRDVHRLFDAALANKTVYSVTRALLYSWYSDYLYLHERNLLAAMQILGKALAIFPDDASNQLKQAQLLYLDDRKQESLNLLKRLGQSNFTASEKKTYTLLLACTEGQESSCLEMQK